MVAEVRAMTNREYHSDNTHVGNSGLSKFHENRLEYYLVREGIIPPKPQSEDMAVSDAAHCLILGTFEEQCFVLSPGPYLSNAAKTLKAKELLENRDKTCLTPDQLVHAQKMADAVMSNKDARALIEGAQHEISVFGVHEPTGTRIKARFDSLTPHGDVVDLKFLRRPDDEDLDRAWEKALYKFGYYRQAALYGLLRDDLGYSGDHWNIVCMKGDKEWHTNPVLVRKVGADTLALGKKHIDLLLSELKACNDLEAVLPGADNWMPPYLAARESNVPAYAFTEVFVP